MKIPTNMRMHKFQVWMGRKYVWIIITKTKIHTEKHMCEEALEEISKTWKQP